MFVQLSLSEWKEKLRCGASGRNTTEDILWTQKPEIQNSWQSHPVVDEILQSGPHGLAEAG